MNKTVEQAVEDLGGYVSTSEYADVLCHDGRRYHWCIDNAVMIQQNPEWVVCTRAEFEQAVTQLKAKQVCDASIDVEGQGCVNTDAHGWVDGLPPVGVECEAIFDNDSQRETLWEKARIIAHDEDRIVGRWLTGGKVGNIFDYYAGRGVLRPIQSGRDKAIAQAWDEVGMLHSIHGCPTEEKKAFEEAISAMIDLGYRKQISRKEARAALAKWLEDERGYTYEELLDALGWERDE